MTEVHVVIFNLIYAYFITEIILKQLFTSVSVIIGECSPRHWLRFFYTPCILLSSYDLLQWDRHVGQNTSQGERNRSTK